MRPEVREGGLVFLEIVYDLDLFLMDGGFVDSNSDSDSEQFHDSSSSVGGSGSGSGIASSATVILVEPTAALQTAEQRRAAAESARRQAEGDLKVAQELLAQSEQGRREDAAAAARAQRGKQRLLVSVEASASDEEADDSDGEKPKKKKIKKGKTGKKGKKGKKDKKAETESEAEESDEEERAALLQEIAAKEALRQEAVARRREVEKRVDESERERRMAEVQRDGFRMYVQQLQHEVQLIQGQMAGGNTAVPMLDSVALQAVVARVEAAQASAAIRHAWELAQVQTEAAALKAAALEKDGQHAAALSAAGAKLAAAEARARALEARLERADADGQFQAGGAEAEAGEGGEEAIPMGEQEQQDSAGRVKLE
jgi:hypothetical protein